MPAQPSNFETFNSDYDKVNRIDVKTWEKRKVYDDKPYLILPNFKFTIKLGDSSPALKLFVKKGGEQFGDAITLPQLTTYTIKLSVYDFNGNTVFTGPMTVSNEYGGEIEYEFHPLDFSKTGIYYCDVSFTKDGKTFTLPDTHVKFEIIVRE